jgi:cysteine desulfurase/selenocysteine lyase
VDAIQSLGVVPMDVREYKIDFLAADGHKWLLAPEGTGIFYCRRGLAKSLRPSLIGWKSVENDTEFEKIDLVLKDNALRFEEGSFSVMGIYALGAALDLLTEVGIGQIRDIVQGLGDAIIREAEKRGFDIKTPRDRKERAGIISFSGDFDPVLLRERLRDVDIIVNYRGGALRAAPHFYNTEEEILRLFEAIDRIIPSL